MAKNDKTKEVVAEVAEPSLPSPQVETRLSKLGGYEALKKNKNKPIYERYMDLSTEEIALI